MGDVPVPDRSLIRGEHAELLSTGRGQLAALGEVDLPMMAI